MNRNRPAGADAQRELDRGPRLHPRQGRGAEQLDPERTVFDTIGDGNQTVTANGRSRHVNAYLKDFLFPPERAQSPVKALSGGERNRLLLARLLTRAANVIVLDEPTNDLDIETLELLEAQLVAWPGTLLLVSHDRAFLDNVVTSTLAFEGETGPYLQYSVVCARNIFRKFSEAHPDFSPGKLGSSVSHEQLKRFFAGERGAELWEMALLAAQMEMAADQAISSEEPAAVAKYAFRLAQAFNNFYHYFHILSESDPERQQCLLYLVHIASESLARALEVLGIEVPPYM